MTFERRGNRIYVDDWHHEKRWSFRVDEPGEVINYLLRICPTTKDAMRKLADMRRGLRLTTNTQEPGR